MKTSEQIKIEKELRKQLSMIIYNFLKEADDILLDISPPQMTEAAYGELRRIHDRIRQARLCLLVIER